MTEYKYTERLLDDIERLLEANSQLREGVEEQQERIKRLEEAGDAMEWWLSCHRNLGSDATLANAWRKAKEAKL